jgi:hypothetical protein
MSVNSESSKVSADHRPARPLDGAARLHRRPIVVALILTLCVAGVLFAREVLLALPSLGELHRAAAILIFAATYLFLAIGKLPGFHLDRAGAALLGASLMVGFGVLSLEDA